MIELRIEEVVLFRPAIGNYFLHAVGVFKDHVLVPPCTRPRTEVVRDGATGKLQWNSNTFEFRVPGGIHDVATWKTKFFFNVITKDKEKDTVQVLQLGHAKFPCAKKGTFQHIFTSATSNVGTLTVTFAVRKTLPSEELMLEGDPPCYTLPSVGSLSAAGGVLS